MDKKNLSLLGLLLAITAISTAATLIRFTQANLPSLLIATLRLCLSSLFLLPVFLFKNLAEVKTQIDKKNLIWVACSGVFLAAHFFSWISSLEHTSVTSSVVLVTTTPIWVSLISVFFLQEKVNHKFWVGLSISFLGTVAITTLNRQDLSELFTNHYFANVHNQIGLIKGNFLALAGAWCAAGYVIAGKMARKTLSTGSYIFLVYSCAALLLLICSFLTGQFSFAIGLTDWKWLFLLALVPQTIGHSLINWALGVLPATSVSIALLGEPVGSSIMAFLLLNEVPTTGEILGAVLILAGMYVALTSDSR